MEVIKNDDGSITTISSFSEIFMDKDLYEISTDEKKLEFEKEVIDSFNQILLYGQQVTEC